MRSAGGFGSVVRIAISVVLALVLAISILWGALALWFKLPVDGGLKIAAIAIFVLPGLTAILTVFTRKTRNSLYVYAGALAVVGIWWQTLAPPAEGDWADELAHQVSGTIEGDVLTLDNVRAFEWTTLTDKVENWTTRTYDLTKLETVDLFLSYWGDPRMAHFMLSFGFGNDQYLAWSIEVRRVQGGVYSPVADFFKANPLIIVAATEQDVVGVRSNIWENDVHLFRLDVPYDMMRDVLEVYVADANRLAERPVWYNSLFSNCTTVLTRTMRALSMQVPFDYRILVNGYLPELLYDRGRLNTDYSIAEIRALGRITDRVRAAGLSEDYPRIAREGVPTPKP